MVICTGDVAWAQARVNSDTDLAATIVSLLVVLVINVFAWVGVCGVIAVPVKLLSRRGWRSVMRSAFLIGLALGGFATVRQAIVELSRTPPPPLDRIHSPTKVDSADKQRVREIMLEVAKSGYCSASLKHEFWQVLSEYGHVAEEASAFLEIERDDRRATRLFWEDALWAVTKHSPFKSLEREAIEKDLVSRGIMTEFQREQNEQHIDTIVAGHPVVFPDGRERVLTESDIRAILANIEQAQDALRELWSPPEQGVAQ